MCTVALKKVWEPLVYCTHKVIDDSMGRFVVSVSYNTNPQKQAWVKHADFF